MTLRFFIFLSALIFIFKSDAQNSAANMVIENDEAFCKVIFHYSDEFSSVEKEKLENWLNETAVATQRKLGKYPFDLNLYLHRADNSSEPVPWANTERSGEQSVHFHVDTKFALKDFLKDWTAPHEISHLAIPFVGKSNSWFAEGFATYMQNEILLEMKQCTQEDIDKKFEEKIANARPYYQEESPFSEVAMNLRKKYRFPQMYWGGAYFFRQLDQILQDEDGRTLCDVMKDYEACCRLEDKSMNDILSSIDKQVKGSPAQDLMRDYRSLPARDIIK